MPILLKSSLYPRRNSAAILFVALWTLVLLSILAIGISSRVASEISLVKYLRERVVSLYLAKAALNQAIIELEKDETLNYDTLYELQKIREKELGNGSFKFTLSDEESLININTASKAIIKRLPGLNSDELAEAIVKSRNPPNPPFQLKEELLLVDGVAGEIYSGLKDLTTVYGDGMVNINTASYSVLEVLGLDGGLIETILTYRKGEDGQEATEDDGVYTTLDAIPEELRSLFRVASKNLKLDISTEVLTRPVNQYSVILERPTGKIRFWQER